MYNLEELKISELKDGDILCYQKDTWIGLPIQFSTRNKISHCGTFSKGKIYEAVLPKVEKNDVKKSIEKSSSIMIQRPKFKFDIYELNKILEEQVGKPYEIRGIWYEIKRQIFGGWDGGNSIKMFFCSKLCLYAFWFILKNNKTFEKWYDCTPADIWEDRKNFDSYILIQD